MTGFFDFLGEMDHYKEHNQPVARMNKRHQFVIRPFLQDIAGQDVLDLAAHDGRWSYAFAAAGAERVLGIEGRQELIDIFKHYPETDYKARVTLQQGDIFEGMEAAIAQGRTFGVVGVLGVFYHIMDHFRLLQLIRKLKPKLIIIDSDFIQRAAPLIQLGLEHTGNVLNANPQIEGQTMALKGTPTFSAMEQMATALNYSTTWLPWISLPEDQRGGVQDYFRAKPGRLVIRATCCLRPL